MQHLLSPVTLCNGLLVHSFHDFPIWQHFGDFVPLTRATTSSFIYNVRRICDNTSSRPCPCPCPRSSFLSLFLSLLFFSSPRPRHKYSKKQNIMMLFVHKHIPQNLDTPRPCCEVQRSLYFVVQLLPCLQYPVEIHRADGVSHCRLRKLLHVVPL